MMLKKLIKNKIFLGVLIFLLCFSFYFYGWMTQKNKLESTLYTVDTITGIVVEVTPTDGSKFDPAAEYHLAILPRSSYIFGFPSEKPTELVRFAYSLDLPVSYFSVDPVSVGDEITVMSMFHPADITYNASHTDIIYPIVTFDNKGQYPKLPDWLQN